MSTTAWVWIIVIVVIVIVGFMFFGGRQSSQPPITLPTEQTSPLVGTEQQPLGSPSATVEPLNVTGQPETSSQPTVQMTSSTVNISNFAFMPASLTIKAGTTVTWINQDSVPHDVKGDTFSSPTLSNGDTYKFTFTTPGTYSYICSIHPSMKGTIVVQ